MHAHAPACGIDARARHLGVAKLVLRIPQCSKAADAFIAPELQRHLRPCANLVVVHAQDLAEYQLLGGYNGEVLVQKEYDDNLSYDFTLGDNVRDDKTFTLWPTDDQGEPAELQTPNFPPNLPPGKLFRHSTITEDAERSAYPQLAIMMIRGGCT